jgi:predicted DCC family thiol-disulfide oxidoreductase YuxK
MVNLPPHTQEHDQIVLYDAVCKLCNGWSKFLIKHDKGFKFKLCSVQSAEGQEILKWFGLPQDSFETMLLVQGDRAYTKSDAFLKVVGQLGRPWSFLSIVRYLNKHVRDWFYDRAALNRYALFGKYEYCVLPSEHDANRFIGGS